MLRDELKLVKNGFSTRKVFDDPTERTELLWSMKIAYQKILPVMFDAKKSRRRNPDLAVS